MNYMNLGKPCRNFCILGAVKIADPVDGNEKIVASSFVSGGTGEIIIIDFQNGTGESFRLPGDEGAWALLNIENEKLLAGTCGRFGYLHCFNLRSRTWAKPLKDSDNTYIWNLVMASDGYVYGGTWPGCSLLRYDPASHTLANLGRMSDKMGNQYSRTVFGNIEGKLFINCGVEFPHITVWDLNKKKAGRIFNPGDQVKELTKEFICVENNGLVKFYDTGGYEKLDEKVYIEKLKKTDARLGTHFNGYALEYKDKTIAGIVSHEYFILGKNEIEPVFRKIPVEPPATGILTMTCDLYGKIWGSSNFGNTIFCYNTENNEFFNTTSVIRNNGEAYGVCFTRDKVFMSCYAGGDHVVYDPSGPWDMVHNINPRALKSVGPDLVRPYAKSIIGPDGAFWTGWTAKYGTYGGGISRVDTDTLEVSSWYDPVEGQALAGITCDDSYIYFTTNGSANGLKTKEGPFYLCKWSTGGELVAKAEFKKHEIPGVLATAGGFLMVSAADELDVFECETLKLIKKIKLYKNCSCIINYRQQDFAVFCGDRFMIVNPEKGIKSDVLNLPGYVGTACRGKNDRIYFAQSADLYCIDM